MKKTAFPSIGLLALIALFAVAFLPFNQISAARPSADFVTENDQTLTAQETAGTYNFDKNHTTIGFSVRHLGLSNIYGRFTDYTGTINYDAADVTKSSVEFTAKVASIDTGVTPRDNHLRTADFFEVEKYPEMSFKSTKIEKRGNGYVATGDFTLKGVTKQIQLPFTVNGVIKEQRGGTRMGAAIETMINRKDYGVNYDSKLPNGTPAVSDDVKINLQIEAVKPAPKPAASPSASN